MKFTALHLAKLIILLTGSASLFAQDVVVVNEPFEKNPSQTYLQLKYHSGTLWTRSDFLDNAFEDPYSSVELRFGWHSTGNRSWQQRYSYPSYGFGLHYSDVIRDRSDTIFGDPISLFGFFYFPWFRTDRLTFGLDMGVGLSYTGLIHDPVTNPLNDVIASHINLYFNVAPTLSVQVSKRLGLSAGAGLTHYSNGKMKSPQKGLNKWGWNVGVSYLLAKPAAGFITHELPIFKDREDLEFMLSAGSVEVVHARTGEVYQYCTSSFTADYVYQFNRKSALTFGVDAFYDGSLDLAFRLRSPEEVPFVRKTYLASHMGYHFIIEQCRLMFNLGTYFRQHHDVRGWIYSRAGARWYFSEHFAAHLAIKTKNGIRSDWIEWGLLYRFEIR